MSVGDVGRSRPQGRFWLATVAGAVIFLFSAGLAVGAVTCPVCKSCSYSFKVGPITITESMSGYGQARVDDFQPNQPRHQVWQSVNMSGQNEYGNTVVTLDHSRISQGVIAAGPIEFPADNRIEFYFIMTTDTPMGPMVLTSDSPMVLRGIINSIPPVNVIYRLESPVDFYRVDDPTHTTVGTLEDSEVLVVPSDPTTVLGGEDLVVTGIHPNPLTNGTTIGYTLSKESFVTVAIHDIAGRRVAALVDKVQSAGMHSTRWDGRDSDGSEVVSGIYFVHLGTEGASTIQKIAVTR